MEGELHYFVQVGTGCPSLVLKVINFEEVSQVKAHGGIRYIKLVVSNKISKYEVVVLLGSSVLEGYRCKVVTY